VAADLDLPPADSADAYLRLHLLSHRLVRPNSMNLDGIFKVLPNVCWTSLGPVAVSEIGAARQRALARGIHLEVRSVDKFPPMLDYVAHCVTCWTHQPSGVRAAAGEQARAGGKTSCVGAGDLARSWCTGRYRHGRSERKGGA
jgi:2,3,4,5-tetrahydropyridine-2-carboxylate N-succinyltransferase